MSALLWGGRPYQLLNAARLGVFESFINSDMKRELENADVLVTGDEDLLTLKNHHTFWIATPAGALAWLNIPV
ncbi:MAG: hypothetical protein QM533_06595 [Cytophagales bacterium]|nr:hypothetical protein [Cytophagales bacterium]